MEDTALPGSTLAKLLKRMDADPGFAGLGASVQTISAISDDSDSGPREISAAVLRDAALTARLLRLANSSSQGRGSRNVSTIDQAIVILGLKTVKAVALSLALLNKLSSKPQSNLLHAEIAASYFCGALAAEITRLSAPRFNAQEAQVCGLLKGIGRMMALYYLYEEIERSRNLQIEENIPEDEAIRRTLGMSFDDISFAIAQHWDLPFVLQESLKPQVLKAPLRTPPVNALGWHQACTSFAHRITDILFRQLENREKLETNAAFEFFRFGLHLKEDEFRESIDRSLKEVGDLLGAISFPCSLDNARTLLRKSSERALDVLSAQDSLTKKSEPTAEKTPIEVIHTTLRLLHEHYRFDRTVLCLVQQANLIAIAGVGRNIAQLTPKFRCFGTKPDLFRIGVSKKTDIYIADLTVPTLAQLLPAWHHEFVKARSCVLLPVMHGGNCLGLIYGDYDAQPESPPGGFGDDIVKGWREQILTSLLAGQAK